MYQPNQKPRTIEQTNHRDALCAELLTELDEWRLRRLDDRALDDLVTALELGSEFFLRVADRVAALYAPAAKKAAREKNAAARRVIAGKPAKKPAKPKAAKKKPKPAAKYKPYQPGTVAQRASAYSAAHGKTRAKQAARAKAPVDRSDLTTVGNLARGEKREAGPSAKHRGDVLDALEKRALDIAATGIVVAGDLVGYALATRGQVATVLGRLTKAGKLLQRGKGRGVQYTLPNGAAAKTPQLELDNANA